MKFRLVIEDTEYGKLRALQVTANNRGLTNNSLVEIIEKEINIEANIPYDSCGFSTIKPNIKPGSFKP